MKIPFVKNIDLVRIICKDKVIYLPENANFAGKQIDYMLASLRAVAPSHLPQVALDLQTGLNIKPLRNVMSAGTSYNINLFLKSQEREIILRVPLTEYINEINTNLKPIESVLDLKQCYVMMDEASMGDDVVLLYTFYNSVPKKYDKLRFAYTKLITVPKDFNGKFSELYFQNNGARLAAITTLDSGYYPAFLNLRDRNNIQNYEYISSNLLRYNIPQKWAFEPFDLDFDKSTIQNQTTKKEFTLYFI